MDLKVINLKPLKKIYFNFLALCLLITIGSFVLYKTGFQLFRGSNWVIEMKDFLLWGMVGLAVIYTMHQVNQRRRLQALLTVEDKITFFEVFYRRRLWWLILSCVVSGFLPIAYSPHDLLLFLFVRSFINACCISIGIDY
jgi:hypothetical protein